MGEQRVRSDRSTSSQGRRQPGYWQTVRSVMAAFLGVQSRKNWEKDMESPSPARYMVVGAVLGFALVGLLIVITWLIANQMNG